MGEAKRYFMRESAHGIYLMNTEGVKKASRLVQLGYKEISWEEYERVRRTRFPIDMVPEVPEVQTRLRLGGGK